jgi:hypothetical protein
MLNATFSYSFVQNKNSHKNPFNKGGFGFKQLYVLSINSLNLCRNKHYFYATLLLYSGILILPANKVIRLQLIVEIVSTKVLEEE